MKNINNLEFNSVNKLDSESIEFFFSEIFLNCKLLNSKIVLFKNIQCKNSEYLSYLLTVNLNEYEVNDNWLLHYFIPIDINSNYLLLVYKNEINIDLINQLNSEFIIHDIDNIIKIWSNEIKWTYELIKNHSFKWKSDEIVDHFLDYICGGLVILLPIHWGKPHYIKELNFELYEKNKLYHNIYLKKNNLEDTIENKINFIKNNKINFDNI